MYVASTADRRHVIQRTRYIEILAEARKLSDFLIDHGDVTVVNAETGDVVASFRHGKELGIETYGAVSL